MQHIRQQHDVIASTQLVHQIAARLERDAVSQTGRVDQLAGDLEHGWQVEHDGAELRVAPHQQGGIGAGSATHVEEPASTGQVEGAERQPARATRVIVHGQNQIASEVLTFADLRVSFLLNRFAAPNGVCQSAPGSVTRRHELHPVAHELRARLDEELLSQTRIGEAVALLVQQAERGAGIQQAQDVLVRSTPTLGEGERCESASVECVKNAQFRGREQHLRAPVAERQFHQLLSELAIRRLFHAGSMQDHWVTSSGPTEELAATGPNSTPSTHTWCTALSTAAPRTNTYALWTAP